MRTDPAKRGGGCRGSNWAAYHAGRDTNRRLRLSLPVVTQAKPQAAIALELIQPKMEAAVIRLGREILVAPVRLLERRVSHVGGRSHVRGANRLRPLRALSGPVVVGEVVVGVVEETVERLVGHRRGRLGSRRRGCQEPRSY